MAKSQKVVLINDKPAYVVSGSTTKNLDGRLSQMQRDFNKLVEVMAAESPDIGFELTVQEIEVL